MRRMDLDDFLNTKIRFLNNHPQIISGIKKFNEFLDALPEGRDKDFAKQRFIECIKFIERAKFRE